ncbi:hypothetical protein JCM9533A_63170 [Catenuloplanes niger JCM 9533]
MPDRRLALHLIAYGQEHIGSRYGEPARQFESESAAGPGDQDPRTAQIADHDLNVR